MPTPSETTRAERLPLIGLAVVIAAAALLYLPHLADAIGGFQHTNEGFYGLLARDYARAPLLAPWLHPLESNNPPLYPWVQALLVRAGADPVVAGRAISLLATLACAALVFALCARLYDRRTGLVAAAVFVFLPGVALVGRNAQTDVPVLALQLAAVTVYAIAAERTGRRSAALLGALAGVLMGAAALTKLSALIALPALALWQVWRTRGLRWLAEPATLGALAVAALTGGTWYGYRAATAAEFLTAQGRILGLANLDIFSDPVLRHWMLTEALWLSGPVAGALAAGGLIASAVRRTAADALVAGMMLAGALFFLVENTHSYYLVAATPWVAIAAARLLCPPGTRRARAWVAVTVAAVLLGALTAATFIGAKKTGAFSMASLPRYLKTVGADQPDTTLMHLERLSFAEEIRYYAPGLRTITDSQAPPAEGHVVLLSSPAVHQGNVPTWSLGRTVTRPVLFGFAIVMDPGNMNHFAPVSVKVAQVGGLVRFGTVAERVDTPYSLYLVR